MNHYLSFFGSAKMPKCHVILMGPLRYSDVTRPLGTRNYVEWLVAQRLLIRPKLKTVNILIVK